MVARRARLGAVRVAVGLCPPVPVAGRRVRSALPPADPERWKDDARRFAPRRLLDRPLRRVVGAGGLGAAGRRLLAHVADRSLRAAGLAARCGAGLSRRPRADDGPTGGRAAGGTRRGHRCPPSVAADPTGRRGGRADRRGRRGERASWRTRRRAGRSPTRSRSTRTGRSSSICWAMMTVASRFSSFGSIRPPTERSPPTAAGSRTRRTPTSTAPTHSPTRPTTEPSKATPLSR